MPMQFEGRKIALKQDRTGYVLTLSVHPDEIPGELLRDFVGARYMCVLARINDDETHRTYNNRVQKAALLCKDQVFWDFLHELTGEAIESEEDAAFNLCSRLNIQSRTELNGNTTAQAMFDQLVNEFKNWGVNDGF